MTWSRRPSAEPVEVALDDLTALAAALTGDAVATARLLAETLATRRKGRATDDLALRALLVQQYLRMPPVPSGPIDDLPAELREVAERLGTVTAAERATLVLIRLKDLPVTEAAGILDSTPTVVRRRLDDVEDRLGADPLTLRATLETLSWRTPDASAVARARVQAERSADRRRWRFRLLGAALAVALLAAVAVPTVRMVQPLPVRAAGDWAFGLELDPPPGWRVELHAVTPDQELLRLIRDSETCEVLASLPSAPEEQRVGMPAGTERAWVGGRPVRYSAGHVRWPYANGGEVTLTCTDQDRAGLLRLAERIRFSAGRPFSLPFALRRVPAGLRLVGAGYEDEMPIIALDRRRPDVFVLITVADSAPTGRRITLDGVDYRLQIEGDTRELCRPVTSVSVCVETGDDDLAVPREVFRQLQLAPDLADRSTWFDANQALPE